MVDYTKSLTVGFAHTRTHLSLNAHSNLQPFIPSIFTRFHSLTHLHLHSGKITSPSINDDGLRLITSRCPNLTRLNLRACPGITSHGMAILSQNCKKLKIFSCSFCRFGAKGVIELLKRCYSLEELSFENLKIDFNVWGRFLEMVAVSDNSLVEVHLEDVDVSDTSLLALSKCSRLQVLHIHNGVLKRIGNEALIAIAKYSLNLQELVLIGVDACCISLEAIAVNCRKLERLHLCSSNKITDVEISCIAGKCVALNKLSIRNCWVSDKGVEAFVLGSPNLVEISLEKCENVTHEVEDRLRAIKGSLVVKLDAVKSETANAIVGDFGVQEHVIEVPPPAGHQPCGCY
ncbi:F-box domain, cyclin-like protein [Artemisia annua]|uniref:F-box domain, cyclin-like protein n=1 Tax=Artemisia annua TaxID=35608 RepID=A0A2U1QEI2_ARTAN|nr:F-box domain, cyclin-like protein [Artemisia annua]